MGAGPETGGAAAFSPASVTGLQAWYKADAGTSTTTDGVAISQWSDQSGNARHLVQATGASQPLYKAAIQNGLPVVRFDGTNDGLIYDAGAAFLSNVAATGFAVFVPRGASAGSGDGRILSTAAVTGAAQDFNSTAASIFVDVSSEATAGPYPTTTYFNSGAHTSTATVATGTSRQTSTVYDGANGSMYQNGTLDPAAFAAVSSFTIRLISTGSDTGLGASSFFNGDVCELLLYVGALGTTDRVNVQNYLKSKWNTP